MTSLSALFRSAFAPPRCLTTPSPWGVSVSVTPTTPIKSRGDFASARALDHRLQALHSEAHAVIVRSKAQANKATKAAGNVAPALARVDVEELPGHHNDLLLERSPEEIEATVERLGQAVEVGDTKRAGGLGTQHVFTLMHHSGRF